MYIPRIMESKLRYLAEHFPVVMVLSLIHI